MNKKEKDNTYNDYLKRLTESSKGEGHAYVITSFTYERYSSFIDFCKKNRCQYYVFKKEENYIDICCRKSIYEQFIRWKSVDRLEQFSCLK